MIFFETPARQLPPGKSLAINAINTARIPTNIRRPDRIRRIGCRSQTPTNTPLKSHAQAPLSPKKRRTPRQETSFITLRLTTGPPPPHRHLNRTPRLLFYKRSPQGPRSHTTLPPHLKTRTFHRPLRAQMPTTSYRTPTYQQNSKSDIGVLSWP